MPDQPSYTGADDTSEGLDRGPTTSTPRWVSVSVIVIVIVLFLLMVVLHLTGALGSGIHGGQ